MKSFFWVFISELRLRYRRRASLFTPVFFFIMLCSLFPLSLPASSSGLLQQIAPGIIWVIALLSTTVGIESLFRQDFDDGVLEQITISGHSLTLWVLAKLLAFWCCSGLIVTFLSPFMAIMLGMHVQKILVLVTGLGIGSLTVVMLNGLGAALTLRLPRGSMVQLLMMVPLYVPVLVFGTGMTVMDVSSAQAWASFYFLMALSVLVITFTPITASTILKNSVD